MTGRVAHIDYNRGFAFVWTDDRREFFFHIKDLRPGFPFHWLMSGMVVLFNPIESPRGLRANDVRTPEHEQEAA